MSQILTVISLVGLVEEIPELVKIATTFLPALARIPVLGKVIPLFSTGQMNETKALEQLQSEIDKKKQQREQTKKQYNKRVIKLNDAMSCVESQLMNPTVLLDAGKAILSTIATGLIGTGGTKSLSEILVERVWQCMIRKMLSQSSERTETRTSKHARPALGHGKGRKTFG